MRTILRSHNEYSDHQRRYRVYGYAVRCSDQKCAMSGMACRFVCIQETFFDKVAQPGSYLDVSFASARNVPDQTALRRCTSVERAAHQETALAYAHRGSAID